MSLLVKTAQIFSLLGTGATIPFATKFMQGEKKFTLGGALD
ncbi:hypothetical protein [Mycoplasma wenyonii]|nr:hypothetical protein [Mycoplasma wenyonii]